MKDGEYYWLDGIGIDPKEPLMIGRYIEPNRWRIDGEVYTSGPGITVLRRIIPPRKKKA